MYVVFKIHLCNKQPYSPQRQLVFILINDFLYILLDFLNVITSGTEPVYHIALKNARNQQNTVKTQDEEKPSSCVTIFSYFLRSVTVTAFHWMGYSGTDRFSPTA